MANKRQRYFSDDDIVHGITPSQLKRIGRERQKEYMRHWFDRNFEDPAQETPYNSEEGGYLYIWGGPYDTHEELYDEFSTVVSEKVIEEVADDIEAETGVSDWAPGRDHRATRDREEEWQRERDERDDEPPQRETLEQITERLRSGAARPSYGDGLEREQRNAIRVDLDKLNAALAQVTPIHGGIGHNNPPPDDESPQAAVVVDVRMASETISRELAKAEADTLSSR